MPSSRIPPAPGGLGLKIAGGVLLATENWTQKDRGKKGIWGKKIEFCKDW